MADLGLHVGRRADEDARHDVVGAGELHLMVKVNVLVDRPLGAGHLERRIQCADYNENKHVGHAGAKDAGVEAAEVKAGKLLPERRRRDLGVEPACITQLIHREAGTHGDDVEQRRWPDHAEGEEDKGVAHVVLLGIP